MHLQLAAVKTQCIVSSYTSFVKNLFLKKVLDSNVQVSDVRQRTSPKGNTVYIAPSYEEENEPETRKRKRHRCSSQRGIPT